MKIAAFDVRDDERSAFEHAEKELGCTICCYEESLNADNMDRVTGFDGITVLGNSVVGRSLIDGLKALNIMFISTRTIGHDNIDIEYAQEKKIRVCNSAYGPESVAEYTIMLILMALRHYKQALLRSKVNDYTLTGLQGRELNDLTVGVVGAGKIGKAVIKNLSGFGCRLMTTSSKKDNEIAGIAEYCKIEDIYKECDIISYHVPLTDRTHHMVNMETLARMKNGVVLINVSRGELMDNRCLEWGIETQKISALGLDVVEGEQGIYHEDKRKDIVKNKDMVYLRQFPNVVMTQHLAFYTDSAVNEMVRQAIDGLVRMYSGKPCLTEL